MNSSIYKIKMWHKRMRPKKNSFSFRLFMFYLDLDELDTLTRKFRFFSHNKWNIFGFYDKDHFKFIHNNSKVSKKISNEKVNYNPKKYIGKDTKQRIKTMVKELKLGFEVEKVYVLTNLRVFGYVFNPVSFYFCFDKNGVFRALFSEVNNTYGDQKMYYMTNSDPKAKVFHDRQKKNYYISPFIDYDTELVWKFSIPKKKLAMEIDSVKKNCSVLKAILRGERKMISDARLFLINFRYPVMTLMIISYIYYQALKLSLKKIKFRNKKETDKKIAESI